MQKVTISLGSGIGKNLTMKPRQKLYHIYNITVLEGPITVKELTDYFEDRFGPGIEKF